MILLTALALMAVLDVLYTYVYETSKPKNKIQYLLRMKPQKIDYVFLGSSRTLNHIVPETVTEITGKSAMNFGIEGSTLRDNLLELEILLKRNVKMSAVFINVDNVYNRESASTLVMTDAMPFIRNPLLVEYFRENAEDFHLKYYIPFYRYMSADYALGIRSVIQSVIGSTQFVDHRNGFKPRLVVQQMKSLSLPDEAPAKNQSLEQIKQLCQKHDIDLVLFCSPICSKTGKMDYVQKLKIRLPELKDYSTTAHDSLFGNCKHLLEKGAVIFTRQLMLDYQDDLKRKSGAKPD